MNFYIQIVQGKQKSILRFSIKNRISVKKQHKRQREGNEWKTHTVVHSAPICGSDYSYAEFKKKRVNEKHTHKKRETAFQC